jgi:hypothetical protein
VPVLSERFELLVAESRKRPMGVRGLIRRCRERRVHDDHNRPRGCDNQPTWLNRAGGALLG